MGYEVHITRAEHWAHSEQSPIELDEWTALVDADSEMQLDDAVIAVDGKPALVYQNPGLAVWTGYSRHDPAGNKAWFDYRRGRVVVKNPDEEILAQMQKIAGRLGARVVGDDGEAY
jgi:hypothetical protein